MRKVKKVTNTKLKFKQNSKFYGKTTAQTK